MHKDLKEFLDKKVEQYNTIDFIYSDPVSIPHMYNNKEDIEISGFLTSVFAWGRRAAIIKSANRLMELMDNAPHDFLLNSEEKDMQRFEGFVYRTFNSDDCLFMINALREVYRNKGGLEKIATESFNQYNNIMDVIVGIRESLLEYPHLARSRKHLANPLSGSAAKRVNMYLRWMIRQDDQGVDFGLWKEIPASSLMCPLDVHSGNVARKFGLLSRKQNDWKSVEELTATLRRFDADDPVRYDFALFGIGVFDDSATLPGF